MNSFILIFLFQSDHNAFCEDCGDGGDLLLCDTCRCAYHQKCAKLETIPDGTWSCPQCVRDYRDVHDIESFVRSDLVSM